MDKRFSWKGFLRTMIALWTMISPWVLVHLSMALPSQVQFNVGALWNFLVVGLVMMVTSIVLQANSTVWQGRINAAMGVWLIASPWVLGFRSDLVLTWNAVVIGVLTLAVTGLRG
ncbi:MAG: hypothetical protein E5X65_26060 [Mesorhizobium sp.]|nr:MAG: hypothetical protein E5X65_26060 [Mesorhizobium sp.]